MPLGTLIDITHPYSPLTAWGYDAFIARAVQRLVSGVLVELVERLPRGASVLDVGCGGGQILLALANYSAELGDYAKARAYAQQLVQLAPRNTNYQQLLSSLPND